MLCFFFYSTALLRVVVTDDLVDGTTTGLVGTSVFFLILVFLLEVLFLSLSSHSSAERCRNCSGTVSGMEGEGLVTATGAGETKEVMEKSTKNIVNEIVGRAGESIR